MPPMAGSATIVDLVQTSRLPHRRSRKSHHLVRLRLHQLQVDLRRRRDDGAATSAHAMAPRLIAPQSDVGVRMPFSRSILLSDVGSTNGTILFSN
jgi:hypothetical protein